MSEAEHSDIQAPVSPRSLDVKAARQVVKLKNSLKRSLTHYTYNIVRSRRFKLKRLTLASLVIALTTISLAYLENELYYSNDNSESIVTRLLRVMIGFLTAAQLYMIVLYYIERLNNEKSDETIDEDTKLHENKKLFRMMLFELAVNCIFLPPFANYEFKVYQISIYTNATLNDIVFCAICLKFYHLSKYLYYRSRFNNERGKFFCRAQNIEFSISFSLKAYISDSPIICISSLSVFLLLITGILLRIAERSIPGSPFYDI